MARIKRGVAEHLKLKRRLRTEMTTAEKRLWARLRAKQIQALTFRRQHGIGPYVVDFYCSEHRVVIEVDGDIHADPNQMVKDDQRETYLKGLGLEVIRYRNDDVLHNLEGVLEDLLQRLAVASTSPCPSLQRRGRWKVN